jgi:hypothetical protein
MPWPGSACAGRRRARRRRRPGPGGRRLPPARSRARSAQARPAGRGWRRRPRRRPPSRPGRQRPARGRSWPWPGPAWSQTRPGRGHRPPASGQDHRSSPAAGTAPGRSARARRCWRTPGRRRPGRSRSARRYRVLALHPNRRRPLLEIPGLVHHQDRLVLAEVLDHIAPHVIAHLVVVPHRPGQQVLPSRRAWGRRRARRSSSSSCVAGRPAAHARTPWRAVADPPDRTGPRRGPAARPTLPAIGQAPQLRCRLQPPSDLRLSSQHRIINGGRPGLLAASDRPRPVRSRSTAAVLGAC